MRGVNDRLLPFLAYAHLIDWLTQCIAYSARTPVQSRRCARHHRGRCDQDDDGNSADIAVRAAYHVSNAIAGRAQVPDRRRRASGAARRGAGGRGVRAHTDAAEAHQALVCVALTTREQDEPRAFLDAHAHARAAVGRGARGGACGAVRHRTQLASGGGDAGGGEHAGADGVAVGVGGAAPGGGGGERGRR